MHIRKVIALIMTIILVLSNIGFAGNIEGDMSNLIKEDSKVVAFDRFLVENNLHSDVYKYLSDEDINDIYSIITVNNLDDINKMSIITSWIQFKQNKINYNTIPQAARPSVLPEEQLKMNGEDMSIMSATNLTDRIHSWDNSGSHYMVRSYTGYNKATGFFTLPSVYVNQSLGANHDVPYGFFGMYIGSDFGMDLGVGYDVDSSYPSKWFMFISGYYKTPSGSFSSVWKSIGIPNGVTRVYLNAGVSRNSNGEVYKLDVLNANTWTLIGSITFDTLHEANSKPFYTNSTYSNLFNNREVTLAFPNDSTRLPNSGSYLKNAFWDQVHLYTPTNYYIWGTNLTQFASRVGKSTAFINSVTVNPSTKWSTDTTTIQY